MWDLAMFGTYFYTDATAHSIMARNKTHSGCPRNVRGAFCHLPAAAAGVVQRVPSSLLPAARIIIPT